MGSLVYLTDNPFDLEGSNSEMASMGLISARLLGRLSNFDINVDFQLAIGEATMLQMLPSATHSGSLLVSYNIGQPEFFMSAAKAQSYYYHFFGAFLTAYVLVFYFIKAVVVDPIGQDKGQLVPHLLLLKTPVLIVYPSYAELIDYCEGFMLLDLPWLNAYFSDLLADFTGIAPSPYLLFYPSLSIASTYLLPVIAICLLALLLAIAAYMWEAWRPTLANIALFLYNCFLAGLALAAAASIQGIFLNIAEEFTVESSFYLLGLVLFGGLLG
jgi:hypothetical protein